MPNNSTASSLDIPHPYGNTSPDSNQIWQQNIKDRLDKGIQFSTTLSADQSLTTSTITKINFDTLGYDSRGEWDKTNNRLTVINPGVRQFTISAKLSVTGTAPAISFPNPPFAGAQNKTLINTSTNTLTVTEGRDFVAGMYLGAFQDATDGVGLSSLRWYTILSVTPNGTGDEATIVLTSNINGNVQQLQNNAYVYGVRPTTLTAASALEFYLYLYKNGTEIAKTHLTGTGATDPVLQLVFDDNGDRGDYYEAYAQQVSSGSLSIASGTSTYFQGKRN